MERGYCQCGCGELAPIAARTNLARGDIKGQPTKYILGHVARKHFKDTPEYIEEDRGYETPCWTWQRGKNDRGYGQVRVDAERHKEYAHRVFYERQYGRIADNLELDHLCRVPSCVNPAHLEAVTHRENNLRGDKAKKLNAEKACEIYDLASNSTFSDGEIGTLFGVHRSMVYLIRTGKCWARETGLECSKHAGLV